MSCPGCGAENRDAAESCASCGQVLSLRAGTVLADRYEIKSLLGLGGLGRVYCAHDRVLDEIVAVKVLHAEAARSPEMSKRFRSEIKLARRVRHRNVCAIHEYGEHEGSRFVAMELVNGVDLHRVLRERGPLPPREGFEIAIQVTKGLAAIHGAGVIHRDLKTPNIMRDAQGDVRLLDFGIAKLISPTGTMAVTAIQKVVGTPEYMSPEQIRGDGLDERSDLYGLGVVIYELFTGVVPFQGKSPVDTLVKHMNTPPPLYGEAAARLPQSLVPILRRLLAKRPEERYGSARELLDALRVARQGTFPEAVTTPSGLQSVEPAEAGPQGTAVLPRPGRPAGPQAPGFVPPPGPPAAATPLPPPARPTPSSSAPSAAPAARPSPPLTPPSGPPHHPLPGAPPLPSARELAAEAALDRSATFIELPQHPEPGSAPGPLPALPAAAYGGRGAVRLAAGIAGLGLLAVIGAALWRGRPPAVELDKAPPTTVAQHPPGPTVPPPPSGPPQALPAPSAPTPTPSGGPTPLIREVVSPQAPDRAPSPPPASSPTPRPRRPRPSPSASPSPSPTPEPTATPIPVPTTGTLDLSVKPDAEVEIDGKPAGSAPIAGLPLPVGNRVLKLSHPSYWPITRRITLEPGRSERLDVDLSWEAVPRARSKAAPYAEAVDGSPSDEYFGRGLEQLAAGDFREAILTLEPVARRLRQASKEKELARTELYLGVAFLELNRQGDAKERFQRALELDRNLRIPATGFSPKVASFFATVREAVRQKP